MAITPPSIASVLAASKVSAPAPVAATSTTTSAPSTKSSAQVFADNLAARRAANSTIINPTVIKAADPSQAEGSLGYFTSKGFDPVSAKNLVDNYNLKMSNTYERFNDSSGGTYMAQAPNGVPIASTITGRSGPVLNIKSTPIPTNQSARPTLNLSPVQRVQVGNVLSSYKNAINSSQGDRASYNKSINYDTLTEGKKKMADRLFDDEEKKKKANIPLTPYDENPLITAEQKRKAEENRMQQELLDQQRKDTLETEMQNKEIADQPIIQAQSETISERDRTIAEQEQMAQAAESNRLNQLRGNIMSRLAQRGVDISRLSPEQITALSGEEGSKAFMDVADIKDRKTKTIEAVRQNALAKLNELRDKKSLNQTAYNSRLNEINSKTAAAKLQAEKEFGANVFALSQTKEQQSRADALARVNAAQTYLTASGVSGPVAASAIANLTSRGLPDETIRSIAQSPEFIQQLKATQAATLAQTQLDNALKQGKLTLAQYDSETKRIAATRPRAAGGITIIGDAGQFGNNSGN